VRSIVPITQHKGRLISLDDYDRLRRVNVGIIPEYALNEMFGELRLSSSFLDSATVRRLGDLAALIIAYCNDVYSYEREAERKTQLNSLEIRRLQGELSLPEAYAQQLQRIGEMVAEFEALHSCLRQERIIGWSTESDGLASARRRRQQTHYLDAMAAIIVGNHYWSISDGRYSSGNSPFAELRTGARRHHAPSRVAK
jgi:hypothetical protein